MSLEKYASVLADAIGDHAIGAQIPDEFGFPTNTTYFESLVRVEALYDATTNSQNFYLLIIPSLMGAFSSAPNGINQMSGQGCTIGNAAGNADFTMTGPFAQQWEINGTNLTGITDVPQGLNQFEKYRVVGVGCQIVDETNGLSANGTFYGAEFPVSETFPPMSKGVGWRFLWPEFLSYLNAPGIDSVGSGGYISLGVSSLPCSFQLGWADFMKQGGLRLSTRPIAPSALDWLDTYNDVGSEGVSVGYCVIRPGAPDTVSAVSLITCFNYLFLISGVFRLLIRNI